MSGKPFLLVNIDTDPDPEDTPRNDAAVMAKYRTMAELTDQRTGGAAAWCVQTSPMYRTRFLEDPFVPFWKERVAAGADLILHPEEDLYATPETKCPNGSWYADIAHMREVIIGSLEKARAAGLELTCYKGGYHGLTPEIVAVVKEAGIGIELTSAPGINWPVKTADWGDAPTSAYLMSNARPATPASSDSDVSLVQIPFGWDGIDSDTTARHLLNTHYLVNEFSDLENMKRVWDVICGRAADGGDQIVSLLCHTYTMDDAIYRDRLAAFLDYVVETGGTFVSASQAADMVRAA